MNRPKKYNTPYTGDKEQTEEAFQEYLSCVADCFGRPYDDRDNKNIFANYSEDECSRHAEDSRKYRERRKTVEKLHEKIKDERKLAVAGETHSAEINTEKLENDLWQCIIAYQNYPFYTSSGLPFSYTVRRKKNGKYSGELAISRKEASKTLTRSSVLLAFYKVLEGMQTTEAVDLDGVPSTTLILPEYKGPKAIGQIFGISYVYSLFWKWRLIQVPGKVEKKLRGGSRE